MNDKYNSTSITMCVCVCMCVCVFSHPVVSSSLWFNGLQHTRHPCPSPFPGVCHLHVHCISDAMQPSCRLMPSSPALNLSQHQGLFQWVDCSHQVAEILELQLQHQSFQWLLRIFLKIDWFDLLAVQGTLRSLLQHYSSKVINSLALCLLYGPALTTVCDHWEDHSLYGPLSAE